ncbi:7517_t:CDS:1 [Ambispora gerdemannii]|uniref:7517_t:CDS:1 n=1 Tax=Ambispora gerdemannii TaxID=144530 RepID=A0A9N9FCU4_9GLOM|nr:7517_t:CDS:1 [Ambispora gerdemannii]
MPLTLPTFAQSLFQALAVWLITSFVSVPISFFLAFWDFPKAAYNIFFAEQPNVIFITGASSGIGEAIAVNYARKGVTLGLLARNEERLRRVAQKCENKGANVAIYICDIINIKQLIQILDDFDAKHPIDLIIANAAIAGATRESRENKWEDYWDKIIEVNLKGTLATVMTVYKKMQRRRKGQIAINSSIAGYYAIPQMCYYSATKAALNSFGRDLRYLGYTHNIKVSVITPGLIGSRMTQDPKAPLPFPGWLIASPEKLAKIVEWGLRQDISVIAWPFWEFLPSYVSVTLPLRIAELNTILIGLLWSLVSVDVNRPIT